MKQLVAFFFTLFVFPLLGLCLYAQNSDLPEPQMSTTPGPPPPGLAVPIDSDIIFLIAAGFLLGIWHIMTHHRKLFHK